MGSSIWNSRPVADPSPTFVSDHINIYYFQTLFKTSFD